MKARHRATILATICLVLSFPASVLVLRGTDRLRPQATLEDVLYISSPKVLKRASLGYDGLLADIYWTRAVQYFGSRHSVSMRGQNSVSSSTTILGRNVRKYARTAKAKSSGK